MKPLVGTQEMQKAGGKLRIAIWNQWMTVVRKNHESDKAT